MAAWLCMRSCWFVLFFGSFARYYCDYLRSWIIGSIPLVLTKLQLFTTRTCYVIQFFYLFLFLNLFILRLHKSLWLFHLSWAHCVYLILIANCLHWLRGSKYQFSSYKTITKSFSSLLIGLVNYRTVHCLEYPLNKLSSFI